LQRFEIAISLSHSQSTPKTLHYFADAMPLSTPKRTEIVIAALASIAVASAGFYLYRARRPMPGPAPATPASAATGRAALPSVLSVLSELPPDAPGVGYVDVAALRKLQNSPLAAMLGLAGESPATDKDYADFVRATGFDYTRDLDTAAIAFWLDTGQPLSNNPDVDRILTIADGRFDQPKIKAYALRTGKLQTRGSQSIYEVPGNPPTAFEFLSPTRILLASGKNPANLLGPFKPRPRDSAVEALIDRVGAAPLFAVARTDNLPPTFYDSFRSYAQLEQMARTVRGLTLAGRPNTSDLLLDLDAECDSMTHALEMSTLLEGLRMIGSMALSDPKTRGDMTREQAALLMAILNQAKVSHQDRWVRLTLDLTPSVLGEKVSSSKP
jgi:hypothetical protein